MQEQSDVSLTSDDNVELHIKDTMIAGKYKNNPEAVRVLVSEGGKAYPQPNVGKTYPRTYLPTNDTFTDATLGMQWEWNHNPDNSRWSLLEHPGCLRLYTATVTDSLQWARNSLSQRILGYDPVGKSTSKYYNSLGTIKMITTNMLEGDIAGIAVFQEPYALIGVKVTDGKKRLYFMQQNSLHGTQQKQNGAELKTIFLTVKLCWMNLYLSKPAGAIRV